MQSGTMTARVCSCEGSGRVDYSNQGVSVSNKLSWTRGAEPLLRTQHAQGALHRTGRRACLCICADPHYLTRPRRGCREAC
jgi:hypothetical protein